MIHNDGIVGNFHLWADVIDLLRRKRLKIITFKCNFILYVANLLVYIQ